MVDLERHSRHILLPQVGAKAKTNSQIKSSMFRGWRLREPSNSIPCSSGIGHLTIVDDDVVEISNLQRQVIHRTQMLEFLKHNLLRDLSMNLTRIFSRCN